MKIKSIVLSAIAAIAIALSGASPALAQTTYLPNATQTVSPNVLIGTFTATATSQTSGAFTTFGQSGISISVVGTALTTATWAVQGSNDGVNFFPILQAAIAVPGTTAVTETATVNGIYIANVANLVKIRIVTSGTFTATNVLFRIVGSPNKALL